MATPSLLRSEFDVKRRSKRSEDGEELTPLILRTPKFNWMIHPTWIDRYVSRLLKKCIYFYTTLKLIYYAAWLCRLKWAGLLPFARLVEAQYDVWVQDEERPDENRLDVVGFSRMKFDKSLLSCLVDRWRPETHTFHFPWGEMAPTLQDVSFLLGLPLAGQAIGPVDVPDNWRVEMRDRFAAAFEDFEAPWEGFEEIEPLKQF